MKSSYKMITLVDNLSGQVEITDLDLKGKVQDLFLNIRDLLSRVDKVFSKDLSYIVDITNLRMYVENPFFDGDIRLGKREYKSLFAFRTDICKSFFSYLAKNNLIDIRQYHYLIENKRFEPVIYRIEKTC